MGCMQVRVKPELLVDQNESKIMVPQLKIKSNELDKSTTSFILTDATPVEDVLEKSIVLIASRIPAASSGISITSSSDFEYGTCRGDAISRFLSVRPKLSNDHPKSPDKPAWNESDECYSCRDSFLSSISTDSEESSSDRVKDIRTIWKKSNLQHNRIVDEIYTESDESHATRNNSDWISAKTMINRYRNDQR